MAGGERGQGGGQRDGVEGAAQSEGERQVVGRRAGLELVEEPEALLGKGERQIPSFEKLARHWHDRRRRGASVARQALRDHGGEGGGRGVLEEGAQGDLDAERIAHPRYHLGGEQGVAA